MAYALHRYTGNGSTTNFAVSFPYLSRSHVKVYIDGELQAESTDYTWANASTILFNSAPEDGASILIRRETSRAGRLVNYVNGSANTESVLNRDSRQAFFMAQEALDLAEEGLLRSEEGPFDAGGRRIVNVADPEDAQDAATKHYVDTAPTSAASQAVQAASQAASSAASAVSARNAAQDAQIAAEAAAASAAGAAAASVAGFIGFRNRIINGDMRIDQRNEGSAVTVDTGDTKRSVDRWQAFGTADAGAFTLQRSTDAPPGFTHSLLATVTTAAPSHDANDIYAPFIQAIEGLLVSDLRWGTADAADIAISFWIKTDVAGTYAVALTNAPVQRSYVTTVTVDAADTWERKTLVVPGDTTGTWISTNGAGIVLYIGAVGGSDWHPIGPGWGSAADLTLGSVAAWMGTLGNKLRISGVQLEKGDTAREFEHRPHPIELALCQRYFEKSYSLGTAIGSTTIRGVAFSYVTGSGVNSNGGLSFRFQVAKRDNPTCRVYSPATGTEGKIRDNVADTDRDATNDGIGHNGFFSYTTTGSTGSGLNLTAHFTADADL